MDIIILFNNQNNSIRRYGIILSYYDYNYNVTDKGYCLNIPIKSFHQVLENYQNQVFM